MARIVGARVVSDGGVKIVMAFKCPEIRHSVQINLPVATFGDHDGHDIVSQSQTVIAWIRAAVLYIAIEEVRVAHAPRLVEDDNGLRLVLVGQIATFQIAMELLLEQ